MPVDQTINKIYVYCYVLLNITIHSYSANNGCCNQTKVWLINEVQPLMIYCQQACIALLKLGETPKKLEKPQAKPTYHLKKKPQSYHHQVPAPNESD